MQSKFFGIGLVSEGIGKNSTVGKHHGSPGILMGGLARSDFQDGGGESIVVEHISSNAPNFNAVP
jgi:hypothetical protein